MWKTCPFSCSIIYWPGTWTASTGRGRFSIGEGWWIRIYYEAFVAKMETCRKTDDSSVILFMLILYDTMWSFHLAELSEVFFKRSRMTQTLVGFQLPLPLCRGIRKMESIRSSMKKLPWHSVELVPPPRPNSPLVKPHLNSLKLDFELDRREL